SIMFCIVEHTSGIYSLSLHDALPILGDGHDDDAGVQRLVLLVGDEMAVLFFVGVGDDDFVRGDEGEAAGLEVAFLGQAEEVPEEDRKSTRLNSSHVKISYAVFCLKKK